MTAGAHPFVAANGIAKCEAATGDHVHCGLKTSEWYTQGTVEVRAKWTTVDEWDPWFGFHDYSGGKFHVFYGTSSLTNYLSAATYIKGDATYGSSSGYKKFTLGDSANTNAWHTYKIVWDPSGTTKYYVKEGKAFKKVAETTEAKGSMPVGFAEYMDLSTNLEIDYISYTNKV
ncbi:MAG: family 16 glycosylhydrolase [Candidatus Diapherotrites archaeon]|nr:family 16 glycosylhydrolase [Candidatus Diapherotrites archaeon]